MASKRIALFIAAALGVAVLATSGCTPAAKQTPAGAASSGRQVATPQTSVEPTVSIPINTSGAITTPASGGAERKALLDAAREKLGISTSFYVYQLFVQGDTALGDLDPVAQTKNGRVFVAWEKRNGVWGAIGATKFGSAAANAADTARGLPSFSAELIGKIDWTLPKPKIAATVTKASLTAATAKTGLEKSAKEWASKVLAGADTPYKLTILKVAEDSKGVWWGRAVVQPSGNNEALEFWAKYAEGSWNGSVQDPDPPAATTFYPASVTSKLGF